MNEFTNRRAGKAVTAAETVAPVSVSEAEEFLGLPAGNPLVESLLVAATDAAVRFTGKDLLTREWTLTHWDWPVWGTLARRNVGHPTGDYRREIELPYAITANVLSVTSYGEPVTDFEARDTSILLNGTGQAGHNDDPAIVVVYEAGFGPAASDVPKAIRQAVLMHAAWLFEHRGDCDADAGLHRSGAASLLSPWRKAELLW